MDSSIAIAGLSCGSIAEFLTWFGFKARLDKAERGHVEIVKEFKKFITEDRCKDTRNDCKKVYDEQLRHGHEQFKSIEDKMMMILNTIQLVAQDVAKINGHLEKPYERN